MWLCGTVENRKVNGSKMFMLHFYCIELFGMYFYSIFCTALQYEKLQHTDNCENLSF